MNRVRIRATPDTLPFGIIENAETGEQIPGVRDISITWPLMEMPIATIEVLTEFDIVADARFVPVFARAGRCESCKWWSGLDFGANGYGACHLAESESNKSFSADQLWTERDFGCILWEPKDDSE
jgi:hypothetical protein